MRKYTPGKSIILVITMAVLSTIFTACGKTATVSETKTEAEPELSVTADEITGETTDETATVRIITTSDIHGKMLPWDYTTDKESLSGSLAQVASAIKDKRNENTVLIELGDSIQGNAADLFLNEDIHPMIKGFNQIGYDVATIGNHEFNFGMGAAKKYIQTQKAKMVLANLYDKDGNRLADPYTIVERNGIRIAIIGVVTPNIISWDKRNLTGYEVTVPSDEVNKAIREIGDNADVFIVAAHMDRGDELEREGSGIESMSKSCPGIDFICAAHGHNAFAANLESGVPATENGADGSTISVSDISLVRKDGKWNVTGISSEIINTESYEADTDIIKMFESYHNYAREDVRTPIGVLQGGALVEENDIIGIPNAVIKSTRLTSFINEVQKYYTDADVSATSILQKDCNMQGGKISKLDVLNIYPFDNILCKLKMNGKQLKKWMEWAASWYKQSTPEDLKISFSEKSRIYMFDVFSGINYEIDISEPVGSRIKNVTWPDGRPLRDDDEFIVATSNYRTNSVLSGVGEIFKPGEELPEVIEAEVRGDLGTIKMLIVDYVLNVKKGNINPLNENNWKITGFTPDPKKQKIIDELIKKGKIRITDSENARMINTVPVTQKTIDEAMNQ